MHIEIGASGPLHVRRENVRLCLTKPIRILYASDLHLGHRWTRRDPDQLVETAALTRPDLLLLGGDLVDTARSLPGLSRLVADLARSVPVYAVAGNHDESVGLTRVRDAVWAGGGRWLPDEPVVGPVTIDGTVTASGRRSRVHCAHDPAVFPAAAAAGYDLVFAGHLHGGQCVLSNRGDRQYPAAWFNQWHGLRFEERGTRMLVSRGVADTVPLRFNCPREVILCDVS